MSEQTEEMHLQQKQMEELFMRTVAALSGAVDAKDRYTSGHSKRVAKYAKEMAARMGKNEREQEEIYRAGLLHDIGKIRVPEEIINKNGKLTKDEFELIKVHPVIGYRILKGISSDQMIAQGAKYHHERYDGQGYPNGLQGHNIPEIARILGVADSYDAMTSNRSYRATLPQEVVRAEIEKGKGTQFDPEIADIMLEMIDADKDYTMRQEDEIQCTILVVDDVSMEIEMIQFIMEDEPMYTVLGALSGKQALEMLEKMKVDLILLDIRMPKMDGFEVAAHIREISSVPIVFMTADKDFETIQRAMEQGVDDYITKPFLPLTLKEIIHSMLH